MTSLDWALKYCDLGWAPIPLVQGEKKPLIMWEPYHNIRPSRDQVVEWWTKNPKAGIGIITGRGSGIIFFDCDGPEALNIIENQGGFPIILQAGSAKGLHFYLIYPSELEVNNSINKKLLLDVRGMVVTLSPIHPSIHLPLWD